MVTGKKVFRMALLILTLFLFLINIVYPEIIVLNNGKKISGKIIKKGKDNLVIQTVKKKIAIPYSEVKEIIFSESGNFTYHKRRNLLKKSQKNFALSLNMIGLLFELIENEALALDFTMQFRINNSFTFPLNFISVSGGSYYSSGFAISPGLRYYTGKILESFFFGADIIIVLSGGTEIGAGFNLGIAGQLSRDLFIETSLGINSLASNSDETYVLMKINFGIVF